ncbi:hypothetical protein ACOBQB_27865 [Streptomyces sp. G5(2025)]
MELHQITDAEGELMSYFMRDVMGSDIDDPNEEQIREIVASLETATDDEHTDVSLQHESEWCLSVFADRTLWWENVEDSAVAPRRITLESWDKVIETLLKLSRGDIEGVNQLDWQE